MAISIISMEINDMPNAVESAFLKSIWPRTKIAVSNITLVVSPLINGSKNKKMMYKSKLLEPGVIKSQLR